MPTATKSVTNSFSIYLTMIKQCFIYKGAVTKSAVMPVHGSCRKVFQILQKSLGLQDFSYTAEKKMKTLE